MVNVYKIKMNYQNHKTTSTETFGFQTADRVQIILCSMITPKLLRCEDIKYLVDY